MLPEIDLALICDIESDLKKAVRRIRRLVDRYSEEKRLYIAEIEGEIMYNALPALGFEKIVLGAEERYLKIYRENNAVGVAYIEAGGGRARIIVKEYS